MQMSSIKIDNTDVVIIGAGIMGLSTAYYLSRFGLKIYIIEKESYVGGNTTMRCAGGIRTQFSSYENIVLSILNRKKIIELEKDCKTSIAYNSCGYAFAFTDENSAKEAEKAVDLQREMLVDSEFLSSEKMYYMFKNIFIEDVLLTTYCKDDGLINVSMLLTLLKRELYKGGVKILCNTTVQNIEVKNNKISKVILDDGELLTPIVVNAAGPWAKQIGDMVNIRIPIEPSPQQLWVTESVSWANSDMPVLIFSDEGIGIHWESGGLLSGFNKPYRKTETTYAEIDLDWEIQHCKKAVERIPDLYNKKIISRWAGFYETTIDDLPIVGPCGPLGMYCIAGFNGHGISQALACGYLLSSIITDKLIEDFDISCLSFYRFSNTLVKAKKTGYKI